MDELAELTLSHFFKEMGKFIFIKHGVINHMNNNRDFSSISPSAKWMILLKGHTNIPFARNVAELLEYPREYKLDFRKRDFTFWATTLGLEQRYCSIDSLLNELDIKNILELASGYSFRSIAFTRQKEVYYIDTDLPDVIAVKKEFIKQLPNDGLIPAGKLELLPLNALDEVKFLEIISRFPKGEIAIVNEGLLAYLVKHEQEKLCAIIHAVLLEHGGYWITADVVLKNKESTLGLSYSNEIKKFNEQHDTEGNSFESFEEAEAFFNSMGFVIDKESEVKYSEMSSFKYMIKSLTFGRLFKLRKRKKIQATWRLKAV